MRFKFDSLACCCKAVAWVFVMHKQAVAFFLVTAAQTSLECSA